MRRREEDSRSTASLAAEEKEEEKPSAKVGDPGHGPGTELWWRSPRRGEGCYASGRQDARGGEGGAKKEGRGRKGGDPSGDACALEQDTKSKRNGKYLKEKKVPRHKPLTGACIFGRRATT